MRIVHLGKYYSPVCGGMETHVETLAKNQARLGHDVYVIAINGSGNGQSHGNKYELTQGREFVDEGVKVHLLGRWANIFKLDMVRLSGKLIRSVGGNRQTIFHLHAPNPTFALKLLTQIRIKNLVVSHHSDVIAQGLLSLPFKLVERVVYRRAKLLISDSEQYIAGSPLLKRFRSKTSILPLGIDLCPYVNPSSIALQIATEYKQRYTNPIWLCVGRVCKYKGFETAIRALRNVIGTLLIVGTGPMEAELRALSREVGVQDRVVWLGETDQARLIAAYHAARSLWFTSNARNEGFGQVQVEAMACSTPVINTHIPNSGVGWVSLDNVSGFTVPPSSVESLVNAAKKLATQDDLYRRLSVGARLRAAELFDAEVMAENSIRILGRIISSETVPLKENNS